MDRARIWMRDRMVQTMREEYPITALNLCKTRVPQAMCIVLLGKVVTSIMCQVMCHPPAPCSRGGDGAMVGFHTAKQGSRMGNDGQ